jgi:periplasmic divalent cation tolerance protein
MEIGKQIARDVVSRKLAACVNIVPQVTSIYEWQGKLEEETESMLIMKTSTDRFDALKEAVLKIHP